MAKSNINLRICPKRDNWETQRQQERKRNKAKTDNTEKKYLLIPIATANGKYSLIGNQTELQAIHFLFCTYHSQLPIKKIARQARK